MLWGYLWCTAPQLIKNGTSKVNTHYLVSKMWYSYDNSNIIDKGKEDRRKKLAGPTKNNICILERNVDEKIGKKSGSHLEYFSKLSITFFFSLLKREKKNKMSNSVIMN